MYSLYPPPPFTTATKPEAALCLPHLFEAVICHSANSIRLELGESECPWHVASDCRDASWTNEDVLLEFILCISLVRRKLGSNLDCSFPFPNGVRRLGQCLTPGPN